MWAGCAECQVFLSCLSLLATLEVATAMTACTQGSWASGLPCHGVPGNNKNCLGHGGLLLLAAVGGIAPEGATLLYLI